MSEEQINNNSENNKKEIEEKKSLFYKTGFLNNINISSPTINKDYWEFSNFRFNKKYDLIGNGTYGNIYLSHNKLDNKPYAIKLIEKKNLSLLNCPIELIYKEISIQIQINHPNIIKLYSYYENEENIYMILEYSNKGSLYTLIRKKKYLKENETFHYFIQVLNAVNFLHENNFIHRDIKPENILLNDKNIIKLCDFGWCVKLENNEKKNTICGTYEYMSPELIKNENYDFNVDIWALGILLYEMLHGKSPFKNNINNNLNIKNEKNEIFNNIINLNFNVDDNKNLSLECIDLIYILLRKKINYFENYNNFTVYDIFNHCWVKKYENERIEYLKKINEQNVKKNKSQRIYIKNNLSIDISLSKNILSDVINVKSNNKKITLNNPLIKNNEKDNKLKYSNLYNHIICNSFTNENEKENEIKKSQYDILNRIYSEKSNKKKKIILKNVETKKSFWNSIFS